MATCCYFVFPRPDQVVFGNTHRKKLPRLQATNTCLYIYHNFQNITSCECRDFSVAPVDQSIQSKRWHGKFLPGEVVKKENLSYHQLYLPCLLQYMYLTLEILFPLPQKVSKQMVPSKESIYYSEVTYTYRYNMCIHNGTTPKKYIAMQVLVASVFLMHTTCRILHGKSSCLLQHASRTIPKHR